MHYQVLIFFSSGVNCSEEKQDVFLKARCYCFFFVHCVAAESSPFTHKDTYFADTKIKILSVRWAGGAIALKILLEESGKLRESNAPEEK